MPTIVERLRAMARHEHDDLSIGDEAAALLEEAERVLADALDKERRRYDDTFGAQEHFERNNAVPIALLAKLRESA